jgi:hypothetical protein
MMPAETIWVALVSSLSSVLAAALTSWFNERGEKRQRAREDRIRVEEREEADKQRKEERQWTDQIRAEERRHLQELSSKAIARVRMERLS